MLILINILACIGIVLLGLIFAVLQEIKRRVLTISHQLEYLGAPLEITYGVLSAVPRFGPSAGQKLIQTLERIEEKLHDGEFEVHIAESRRPSGEGGK